MASQVIPKMMKAAVLVKHKEPLVIKEVPVPQNLKSREILVKVVMSGVCHTDVHVVDADWDVKSPLPLVPGHEGCGYVVKVGADVTNVKVGDRVGVPFLHHSCGNCFDCRDGWESVCPTMMATGFLVDGGFAQYVVAREEYVGKIADSLSFEQAAPVMCAGVTVYKALKVSNVKPGQWVVITGAAGGLGHVACQYAKAMGMHVIAVSRKMTPAKEKMLKGFNVDYCLDLSKETIAAGVKTATSGSGPDGVICLAPDNKDITDAVHYIKRRGTIVPVAIPSGSFEADTVTTVLKGISIVGTIVGTRNDLQESLDFAAEGKVKCSVTLRKLEEINTIVTELRQGNIQGRIVLEMPE